MLDFLISNFLYCRGLSGRAAPRRQGKNGEREREEKRVQFKSATDDVTTKGGALNTAHSGRDRRKEKEGSKAAKTLEKEKEGKKGKGRAPRRCRSQPTQGATCPSGRGVCVRRVGKRVKREEEKSEEDEEARVV